MWISGLEYVKDFKSVIGVLRVMQREIISVRIIARDKLICLKLIFYLILMQLAI